MQFVFVLCQLLQCQGYQPPRHLCLTSAPANISTDKLPPQWKVRGERCGEAVWRRGSDLVVLCEVKCHYFDWIKVTSDTLLISRPLWILFSLTFVCLNYSKACDSTEIIEIIIFKEHSAILLFKFQLTITFKLIDHQPLVLIPLPPLDSKNVSCMCHSSFLHLFPCLLSSPPQSLDVPVFCLISPHHLLNHIVNLSQPPQMFSLKSHLTIYNMYCTSQFPQFFARLFNVLLLPQQSSLFHFSPCLFLSQCLTLVLDVALIFHSVFGLYCCRVFCIPVDWFTWYSDSAPPVLSTFTVFLDSKVNHRYSACFQSICNCPFLFWPIVLTI